MRVPRYDGPQVQSTNLPGVNYSDGGISPDTFGAGIGKAIGQAGEVVGQIAQREIEKVNNTRLTEFENGLVNLKQSLLMDPTKGAATVQGKEAPGMTDRFMKDWKGQAFELERSLPAHLKPAAKQMYARHSETVHDSLVRWELQRGDDFHTQQNEAGINLSAQDAVLSRNDPKAIEAAVDRAIVYASNQSRRSGADELIARNASMQAASLVYRGVIEAQIGEDVDVAERNLAKWRPMMTASDQTAIQQRLQPAVDDQVGYAIGQELMSGRVPTVPGGHFDGPVTKIVADASLAKMPSAQRQALRYDDNALNGYAAFVEQQHGLPPGLLNAIKNAGEKSNSNQTSPKGAAGVMQFMPESLKAYGVTDATDPAQMIDAAGRYMKDHLKKYGGDVAAAVAHYNGGGRAGTAVANGGKPPAAETQMYLQRVMGALGGKDTPAPGRIEINEDTPPEALVAMIPRNLTRAQRQSAENAINDAFATKKAFRVAREQEASRSIYDKVTKAPAGKPLSKILTQDELVEYGQNASLAESIGRYRKAISGNEVIEDNPKLVDELFRLQANNPTGFRQRNLMNYSDQLSGKTLLSLRKAQEEMARPDKVQQFASESDLITQEFDKLGIANDSDTEADEVKVARGQYVQSFTLAKEAFYAKNNRLPDTAESRLMLRELTYSSARKRGTYDVGGEKGGARPLFQRLTSWSDANTVPNDERARIVKALQAAGIAEPTEVQIQGTYAESQKGASQ